METMDKIFMWLFLLTGILCLVTVCFGATHQLATAFICFSMAAILKCDLKRNKKIMKKDVGQEVVNTLLTAMDKALKI